MRLHAPFHVCVLRSICWLLCHGFQQPFCPLISLFPMFWFLSVGCRSRSHGLGLHPHTQAYIKGLGSFPYMSMFACLLLCFMSMFACLLLRFMSMFACLDLHLAMLCTLCELMLVGPWGHLHVWLHLSLLGLVWMQPLVRYTSVVLVCLIHTSLSTLCKVDIFALLALFHPFGFFCLFASLHACLHVHACVYVSSQDTLFCLITCLFAFLYAQHALFAPIWLSLLVCSLHTLPFSLVSFFACLLAYFFFLCMYVQGARMLGARAQPPRHEQKGQRRKPIKGNVQQIRGPSPSRVTFSFSLSLSLSLSPLSKPLLQSMYQGSPSMYHLLFSYILLGPHFLGMAMSVLLFLYLAGPYPCNISNVYLLSCSVLCIMCVCV